jgi:hypothetical protein
MRRLQGDKRPNKHTHTKQRASERPRRV